MAKAPDDRRPGRCQGTNCAVVQCMHWARLWFGVMHINVQCSASVSFYLCESCACPFMWNTVQLIEGLTGEKSIFKRRGEKVPEVCVCMRVILNVRFCIVGCLCVICIHT